MLLPKLYQTWVPTGLGTTGFDESLILNVNFYNSELILDVRKTTSSLIFLLKLSLKLCLITAAID